MPESFFVFFHHIFTVIIIHTYIYIPQHLYRYTYICVHIYTYIYIYIWFSLSIRVYVCTKLLAQTNHWYKHVCVCVCVCVYVYVCVCVFCAWVLQCYTVCVCVCVNHISTINHESSNSSWWLSAQSSVTHTTNQNQNKRKLPVWLCTGFSLGYIAPAINYIISGCAICQNYMFSGESNTLPFFRRLKQIWKTERLTEARPTCIPDGRRVAAYVCVNLACTSSIILQSRNTADAHPLIIRSPIWRMP